ncbi:uncharacterized protein LOC112891517 isoform X2 [Panicum hallii]|uniref:uncharacterized protein LOC112891517 isoform X2 n=1 Tax=Panicum hallii TaxID=206008 RepID=UPI000DF4CB3D|nr:uncharacterized protein LOC112891517 isoform X2 [Panicum hallii]
MFHNSGDATHHAPRTLRSLGRSIPSSHPTIQSKNVVPIRFLPRVTDCTTLPCRLLSLAVPLSQCAQALPLPRNTGVAPLATSCIHLPSDAYVPPLTVRGVLQASRLLGVDREQGSQPVRQDRCASESELNPFQHILYPTNVEIPDHLDADLTERKLSRWAKLRSGEADGYSQMCFWELNLRALKNKEAAQIEYLKALTESRDQLQAALYDNTRIGSGYSDYTFR